MLRPECAIVEKLCGEPQAHQRQSPAPFPDRMMRDLPYVQPASLSLLSSLHITLMRASSPGGLDGCMGSHLEDSSCCWAHSKAAERILNPLLIHSCP